MPAFDYPAFFKSLSRSEALVLFAATAAALLILRLTLRALRRSRCERAMNRLVTNLAELATHHFLSQPCSRCHEALMRLVSVSPNARSLAYECAHCDKKMRASAASPSAGQAAAIYKEYLDSLDQWQARYGDGEFSVLFETAEAPLPFEQSSRSPIPESIRAEVWRRDEGSCVSCGVAEQLEFDHIIPLARGGASSVRNLQLLCRSCNASKGDRI